MKLKIISLFLCILMVLTCFTSCKSSGKDSKIVTPIDAAPTSLDPQIVSDTGSKNIVLNCFEGLVSYGENGEIIPAAAEKFDISEDGLRYTFNLRKDGKWRLTTYAKKFLGEDKAESFDNRLLAKDFVFALQRALRPETLCPFANSLLSIKNASKVLSGKLPESELGARATGDYTLEIELEKKDGDFLDTLTSPACMPCNEEFFNLTKGRYGLSLEYILCNGPYFLNVWNEKTAITVRRNTEYHSIGDTISTVVKPISIYYSFNNEQETRAKKLKDGTYTLAPLTVAQASELSADKHITLKSFNTSVTSIIFNCEDEITSVGDIRKALALGMDASVFLEKFGKQRANGLIPSAVKLYGESYRKNAPKPSFITQKNKKAVSLLKDGMDELQISDIELSILTDSENETAVRNAMQSWQSLFGVKFGISVEAVSGSVLKERLASGNFQIALCDLEFDGTTAKNAVSRFKTADRNNIIRLSDKKLDKIIDKLKSTSSKAEASKVIAEAEQYLISACAVIPLCESEVTYGIAKGFSDVVFSPTGEIAYYMNTLSK